MKRFQIYKILLLALLVTFNAFCAYDFEKACKSIGLSHGAKNLRVIDKKDSNRSYVSVLQDTKNGNKFILKQKKNAPCPLQVAQEMLGTTIANRLGILSQKVIIVPPGEFEKLKKIKGNPATLHTFIEDKPIKAIRRLAKLQLRQIKLHSPRDGHGITRKILKSSAKYPDLAAILAVDSGLGIGDRHTANLLFNKSMKRFWLIDMDYTFHGALVEPCIKQIKKLFEGHTKLSRKECEALERYTETLKEIHRRFPEEVLIALLNEFIEQAGITKEKLAASGATEYRSILSNIKKSTEHMEELISLLDAFLSYQTRKRS
jgi:hypothetical protein